MAKIKAKSYRLSIDVSPEEHRKIKILSALYNKSIRSYVREAIKERIEADLEQEGMLVMSAQVDPVLFELWDNEKDSAYDKL